MEKTAQEQKREQELWMKAQHRAIVLVNKGVNYARAGKHSLAIRCYKAALKWYPGCESAHHDLANELANRGQLEEALPHYQQAMEHNRYSEYIPYDMGIAYRNQGRWREALAAFDKAITTIAAHKGIIYGGPNKGDMKRFNRIEAMVEHNKGYVYSRMGNWEEALTSLQRAVALGFNNAEMQHAIGAVYRELGQVKEAQACFEQAMALQPKNRKKKTAQTLLNMGVAYTKAEQYAEAMDCFQKALSMGLNDAALYFYMGLTYMKQGKYEEALAAFEKALTSPGANDTANIYVYRNMAASYRELGVEDKMEECIAKLTALDSKEVYEVTGLPHAKKRRK